ncbi:MULTISPECIES: hypothetical protein [unclassified Pseudomonas]|uniref:hypothetical protein n=1 Tax=unclassified Pseudomonas TaxID=196821 RepID=UPI0011AD481F|nr:MULTISPECIES: hypothetical protein [unclassified Pseudomonas]TWC27652.1 hypothetical protein FBY05_101517 [Pseudomonas sp. SJZ083]TWC54008.1 hypothetical protein FBY01_101199 [Pseudomonas sp. SJZ077]
MPEIKCEYGHTLRISTDEWVSQLSLEQLRYARQQMAEKIDKAEQGPRRTVWLVDDGISVAGFYREDAFAEAADHLLRIYKDVFLREAKDFGGSPGSVHEFKQSIPHIEPRRVTQFEYDTEWFPTKSE